MKINFDAPHRRLNPLTGEWVLVSPQRARRPWLGQVERVPPENLLAYDPACYLCPGNARAAGRSNPAYRGTFVFDNDFPALFPLEAPHSEGEPLRSQPPVAGPLFLAEPASGIARVVCFSPRHDLTLPELGQEEVEGVVRAWVEQTADLGARDFISYVQVFENKGAIMGCSNPHPHSQIWASSYIPNEPEKERLHQASYSQARGRCLLCDTLEAERGRGERVVVSNAHFTAVVPFWAVWPFEVLLLSNHHTASLVDLTPEEVSGLADILRRLTARYDNLFEVSFPYSMGFHPAPSDGQLHESWHLHAHYYPPLLRSATVKKFMVGYELLAMPQRDLTPETAAERLRSVSEAHFRT